MAAVLADPSTAPISERMKLVLPFLRKVTREHAQVIPDDVRSLIAGGVTSAQIEQALAVSWAFNVITRLADTFEFEVGPRASFDAGAKQLLGRGYR